MTPETRIEPFQSGRQRMDRMNIQAPAVKTIDDFLRWSETQDGRYEFVHGRIVRLINVSRNHSRIATRLLMIIGSRLDPDLFDVGAAEFAVRTDAGIRFPDVFVDRVTAETDGKDHLARRLVFAAEVVSPSSQSTDMGEKAAEYTALDSLAHYLVLAQDEPRVWLWSRGEDGGFMKPEMIAGRDETVELTGLGVTLALAELYRGIA